MSSALRFLVQYRTEDKSDSVFMFHRPCLYFLPLSITQRHIMSACLTNRVPSLPSPTAHHRSAFFVRLCAAVNFRSHASSYIQLGGEISFCLGKLCHLTLSWEQPCNRDTLCQPFRLWWHKNCVSGRGYVPQSSPVLVYKYRPKIGLKIK